MENTWTPLPEKETYKLAGSSYQMTCKATFSSLCKLLGPPTGGDGEKVSTEWTMQNPAGDVVSVYDYKDTNIYDPDLPSVEDFRKETENGNYEWHIGAHSKEVARDFLAWLASVGPR